MFPPPLLIFFLLPSPLEGFRGTKWEKTTREKYRKHLLDLLPANPDARRLRDLWCSGALTPRLCSRTPRPDLRIQALDWRHTFFADGVPAPPWQCSQGPRRRRCLQRGDVRKGSVVGRRKKNNGQEIRTMGEKEMCCTTHHPVSLLWFRLRCDRHLMTPSL